MVKACTCPACGHPLPDIAVMLDLTHMQGRMFVALSDAGRRGISGHDLLDRVYVGKPPRTGAKGLSVMKHMMIPALQKHGLKITARSGPNSMWRLETIGG
jgi:hypothetical protein